MSNWTTGTTKLGIVGGMGSWASSYFWSEIIRKTEVEKDQDYIDAVILNHASIPDRTAAQIGGQSEKTEFIAALENDIKLLIEMGCSKIAIPCNTSHLFFSQLTNQYHDILLNMITETIDRVESVLSSESRVGILATRGTVNGGLYQAELTSRGYTPIVPSSADQETIMNIIYQQIKADKPVNFAEFHRIIQGRHAGGAERIILGCTELSLFRDDENLGESRSVFVDALDCLVDASITSVGKTLKNL